LTGCRRFVRRFVQRIPAVFRWIVHRGCANDNPEVNVTRLHLHLVSDSTGETLESLVKAGLAQFEAVDAVKHYWPMVRSEGHLERVLDEVARTPGLVLYTLVARSVRELLEQRCAALGLPVIPVMDPVIAGLERMLGMRAGSRPGGQHRMDAAYFGRIEAINWTMEHDDGLLPQEWEQADMVLAGVSRSSKTPTSLYLANRGYRVANIPIVPARPLPPELFDLKGPIVVGLTVSAERLEQVRRARILGQDVAGISAAYADPDGIKAELNAARRLFADRGWPVLDVTRRSIEETAAELMNMLTVREEQAREAKEAL
jgi:[pyruvate, water dikinase]-phosphate phosphotransferase / [pyruvate, water dikinase] kinase